MAFNLGGVDDAARVVSNRMQVVDAGAVQADSLAQYAKGQNGNDAFKIWPYKSVEALAEADGPELGARYIRFENGEIGYGTLKVQSTVIEDAKSGVFGLGRKPAKTQVERKFIKHPEPTPPPPPSAASIVAEKITLLQGKANDLVSNAKTLGTKQQKAMKTAEQSQQKAKEYLGHAREFLKAGDKDSAIDALYKVVTHSQKGDAYADIAKVIAQERSALMQQVAQFRTGLEKVATQAELQSVRIESAQAMNQVKKEMTGLGSDATTLKEQLGKMDDELANLQAENSAMDEMIANGEVDSLFGDPLAARAEKSSADDAVRQLLEDLTASIQTEKVEESVASSAIGATQATEAAETAAKTAEM